MAINDALTFAPMHKGDLREVLKLEASAFTDPWSKSVFEEFLPGGTGFGITVRAAQELIGYACYFIEPPQVHLTNLAVKPAARRKSVAKRLLDRILDVALDKGCGEIALEVRVSNEAAQRLYEREGFTVSGRLARYYDRPVEDAFVMSRRI